jgi:hypothetical protein
MKEKYCSLLKFACGEDNRIETVIMAGFLCPALGIELLTFVGFSNVSILTDCFQEWIFGLLRKMCGVFRILWFESSMEIIFVSYYIFYLIF